MKKLIAFFTCGALVFASLGAVYQSFQPGGGGTSYWLKDAGGLYSTDIASTTAIPSQGSNYVTVTYLGELGLTPPGNWGDVPFNSNNVWKAMSGVHYTNGILSITNTASETTNVVNYGLLNTATNTVFQEATNAAKTYATPGAWGQVYYNSNSLLSASGLYFTNNTLSLGQRSMNNYDIETYGASGTWQLTRPDNTGSAGFLFAETANGTAKGLIAHRGSAFSSPASQANNFVVYNFVPGGEFTFHAVSSTRIFGISTNDVYGRVPFSSSATPTQLTNFVRLQELRFRPISAGGNATLTTANYHYDINETGAMVTLPDATTCLGWGCVLGLVAPATSGTYTNAGGQKLGGADFITLTATNTTARLRSNGANYVIE